VSVASIVLANGGLIDVGAGKFTAMTGLNQTSLLAAINSGKGNGSWNGTSGIGSSAVAAAVAAGEIRTIGWLANVGSSFTVAYAAPGDTNLDGLIDVLDAAALSSAARFNDTGVWSEGDFNHDGIYDDLDNAIYVSTGLFDAGSYTPATEAPARASGSAVSASDAAFAAFAAESQVGTGRKKSAFSVV
jgi:hypothetical protein